MTFSDEVVVGVVRGRDLDRPGSKRRIGVGVFDHRDDPFEERKPQAGPGQSRITIIGGVDGDRHIGKDCLGPRGGDDDMALAIGERVSDVVQLASDNAPLGFDVGDACLEDGVPVHDALAAVDQPSVEPLNEHLEHGFGVAFVEGKSLAAPIERAPEPPQLPQDRIAALLAPLPDPFHERFAAQLAPARALLAKLLLDDALRGDPCVVLTWQDHHVEPPQSLVASDQVLDRVAEGMAHVKRARDVGRGNGDRENGTSVVSRLK
ncbi:MAG: hypothetical protein CNCCGFBP_00781 [Fimbriimonadaceae bacterium]|nr:hypothetical protein [Fimbriimonadaceae bacterium]